MGDKLTTEGIDKEVSQEQREQEEKEQRERIKYQTECFLSALNPFGGGDVHAMIEWALEAGKDGDWAAEAIQEFMDSCGITKLDDIDPCYTVMDAIYQEARNDINTLTGKDIINDLSPCVEVYGNYMCSSLDGREEAVKDTIKIIKEIPEDERTEVIDWLMEQLENMY